jgi:hypothetical protein
MQIFNPDTFIIGRSAGERMANVSLGSHGRTNRVSLPGHATARTSADRRVVQ